MKLSASLASICLLGARMTESSSPVNKRDRAAKRWFRTGSRSSVKQRLQRRVDNSELWAKIRISCWWFMIDQIQSDAKGTKTEQQQQQKSWLCRQITAQSINRNILIGLLNTKCSSHKFQRKYYSQYPCCFKGFSPDLILVRQLAEKSRFSSCFC